MYSENFLLERLKDWKKYLELTDWYIKLIDDCPIGDFVLKDVQGESEFDTTNKVAVIRIISEKDYGKRILPLNKEKVLIHELLHIKFGMLWDSNSEVQNIILHQLIEDMAKTLYAVSLRCFK